MEYEAVKILSVALALLPIIGVSYALGRIFSSYYEALGRNPTADEQMSKTYFITLAVTEALGIFCIGISALILFTG